MSDEEKPKEEKLTLGNVVGAVSKIISEDEQEKSLLSKVGYHVIGGFILAFILSCFFYIRSKL
ncbi:MAG: hypothetical protein KGJ06_10350 [Pseudomonadota bacterium]|nr:hypothetical protein [Pseudomonadota bacterium]